MILSACDRCDLLITCVLMVQSRVMTPVALSGFEDHKWIIVLGLERTVSMYSGKKRESPIEDLKPSTVYGRKYILFIFYITPFHARLQISWALSPAPP